MSERIFITGAAGCVGHYVWDALRDRPDTQFDLLVRDPQKLRFSPDAQLIQADLRQFDRYQEGLREADIVIHIATAWGGDHTRSVNFEATHRLFDLAERAHTLIYFSTASILDRDNQPLPEAAKWGTEYIQTKYETYQWLKSSPHAARTITLFPTLIFGGDATHPTSHLSGGLGNLRSFAPILNRLTLDATFHFIHAHDIGLIVRHLLDANIRSGDFVLGNPAISGREVFETISRHFELSAKRRLDLTPWLFRLEPLFRYWMNDWDRFCLRYQHFNYSPVTHARGFGLETRFSTLDEILKNAVS